MCRKNFVYLTFFVLLWPSLSTAELKIGYVNVGQVMEKAPQAERAKKDIEKEFSPRNKRIVSAGKELRNLDEKYTRDSSVMSDTERRKLEKDMIDKKREYKRLKEEFSEDFNHRRNEELGQLQRQIIEAIQSFAKEQQFDLVLTDGVIFASEAIDVTESVRERLK